MDYIIESCSSYCGLEKFSINGIQANYSDFGSKKDIDRSNAEPYGCGDMRFIPNLYPKTEVLKKYNITKDEYDLICMKLERELSFGHCGWCI